MSADLNNVTLIGRLTRDAILSYTSGGTAVCKFAIAVNRRVKKGDQWAEEASFFDVTAWGKIGEGLAKYLTKGKQVAVDGELRQDRWEKDGQNTSRVVINADNIQLLGGGTERPAPSRPRGQPASVPEEDYGQRDFPDEIPF